MNLMSLIQHSYVPVLTTHSSSSFYYLSFTCDAINDTDHYKLTREGRYILQQNAQRLADELAKLI